MKYLFGLDRLIMYSLSLSLPIIMPWIMPWTVEYIRSNGINSLKGCKFWEVKPSETRTHPIFERVNWLDIPTNMTQGYV